ncbi:hypothetical protein EV182_006221, partial [Spiromyces aspiralis]
MSCRKNCETGLTMRPLGKAEEEAMDDENEMMVATAVGAAGSMLLKLRMERGRSISINEGRDMVSGLAKDLVGHLHSKSSTMATELSTAVLAAAHRSVSQLEHEAHEALGKTRKYLHGRTSSAIQATCAAAKASGGGGGGGLCCNSGKDRHMAEPSPMTIKKQIAAEAAAATATDRPESEESTTTTTTKWKGKVDQLLTCKEAPRWAVSKYILTGYRELTHSYGGCVRTLGFWHNETGNIMTHLVGTLIFAGLWWGTFSWVLPRSLEQQIHKMAEAASMKLSMETLERIRQHRVPWSDVVVIAVYLASATLCLVFSTLYHLFACHSKE